MSIKNFVLAENYPIKKLFAVIAGISLYSAGISFFLKSELGADPVSVFIDGMYTFFGISYGTALNIFNLVMFILVALVARHQVKIGLLLNVLVCGVIADITDGILTALMPSEPTLLLRVIILIIGLFALSVGTGMMFSAELGGGPLNIIMFAINEKIGCSYTKVRFVTDASFLIAGIVLGGIAGFGTVIGLMFSGVIVDKSLTFFKNIWFRPAVAI